MKIEETIVRKMRLMGLMGLMGLSLAGCTSEEEPSQGMVSSIELTSYVSGYKANGTNGAESRGVTRALGDPVWVPSGFSLDNGSSHPAIGIFLTKNGSEPLDTRIWYGSDSKWRISDTPDPGTYQLYGYVPKDAATVSIAPNGTYSNGAVMTLEGLSPVSAKDICIVVGAKNGTDESTPVAALTTGDFAVEFKTGVGSEYENHIFLLFDHLYAALDFQFKLDVDYAALRTIKIKTLEITAYTDDAFTTKMKKSITNTVTLTKNGRSPMVDEADYNAAPSPIVETPSGADMDAVMFFHDEDEPIELNALAYSTGKKCYVTKNLQYFKLRTTFDVYDSKGNLTRQDCVAENKVDAESYLGALKRGYKYNLKFTVTPTYLYVLSDADLDNPTITID